MIAIVNYEVGNHQSIANALTYLDIDFCLTGRPEELEEAEAFILPGVGAFSEAMQELKKKNLIGLLQREIIEKKKPILGICLGMQILMEYSKENGHHPGFGWVEGGVEKISSARDVRVPHIGWTSLNVKKRDPLFLLTPENPVFYFDHSYSVVCDERYVTATADYASGIIASLQKDHIFGVQFHPEKSQRTGLKLFRGFKNYISSRVKERQHAF